MLADRAILMCCGLNKYMNTYLELELERLSAYLEWMQNPTSILRATDGDDRARYKRNVSAYAAARLIYELITASNGVHGLHRRSLCVPVRSSLKYHEPLRSQ